MKSKKLIAVLLALFILTAVPMSALAYSWSSQTTYQVKILGGWKGTDTKGYKLIDTKETDGSKCRVYTAARTMDTNPDFRMVNSEGKARCSVVRMGTPGNTVTSNNTGKNGHYYYAQVRAHTGQWGTDTIKFKFSAD